MKKILVVLLFVILAVEGGCGDRSTKTNIKGGLLFPEEAEIKKQITQKEVEERFFFVSDNFSQNLVVQNAVLGSGFTNIQPPCRVVINSQSFDFSNQIRFFSTNTPAGVVTLRTLNHFLPTTSLNDPKVKAVIAPFFYKIIEVENTTGTEQNFDIFVEIVDIVGFRENSDGKKIIYYNSTTSTRQAWIDVPAQRAIAAYLYNGQTNEKGFSFSFTLQPGQKKKKILADAWYNGGMALIDERERVGELKFYYTKFFGSIDEVIDFALDPLVQINLIPAAENFSASLKTGDSTIDYITNIAVASYLANSYLVYDQGGNPRYYLNEGCMNFLSSMDLVYDAALFEAEFFPWALKLQLEEWSQYTSQDRYGVFMQHDMGEGSIVTSSQRYPYGDMKVEENLCYISMVFLYWKKTGDIDFLASKTSLIQSLLASIQNRDTNGDGIIEVEAGYTTYDYEKVAMGWGAGNVRIAVSSIAVFIMAEEMEKAVGGTGGNYRQFAAKTAESLKVAFKRFGYLPVSLSASRPGWREQTIVNFEGLLYLFVSGVQDPLIDDLLAVVAPSHYFALQNCQAKYGYRLSSGGAITWLSKTFEAKAINEIFIRRGYYKNDFAIFPMAKSLLGQSQKGFADTWNISTGKLENLYYYPRGVSIFFYIETLKPPC